MLYASFNSALEVTFELVNTPSLTVALFCKASIRQATIFPSLSKTTAATVESIWIVLALDACPIPATTPIPNLYSASAGVFSCSLFPQATNATNANKQTNDNNNFFIFMFSFPFLFLFIPNDLIISYYIFTNNIFCKKKRFLYI